MRSCHIGIERHDGRVIGNVIVLFNAVDQDLECHIRALFLDFRNDFCREAGTVFDTLSTVFILTSVMVTRQEVCRHIEAGAVQLDDFESNVMETFCNLNKSSLFGMDLINRHLILANAKSVHLITQNSTVFSALCYELIDEFQRCLVIFAAFRDFERIDSLNKDEFDAALSDVNVVLK